MRQRSNYLKLNLRDSGFVSEVVRKSPPRDIGVFDRSISLMKNLYQVLGPPGTGKTRFLTKRAAKGAAEYGTKGVLICSLTKAAAHEIQHRADMIPDEMIGTLHAHAYRALGQPTIAESKSKEWNEEYPQFKIGGKASMDDAGEMTGDDLLGKLSQYRMAMVDTDNWSNDVRNFNDYWGPWKQSNGYMDFTDLIEEAIHSVDKAPGDPSLMLGDEAQDWSKLEFELFCENWGKYADKVILAMDADQSLYQWRGADPEYFIDRRLPQERVHVLSQSYRVPKLVHDFSQTWIRKIRNRIDADYNPMERKGLIRTMCARYQDPERVVDDIHMQLDRGKSCMILTTCGYMLKPIIHALKEEGIPYHNPYRKQQAYWNPLQRKSKAVMPVDRVASFLNPKWGKRLKSVIPWSRQEITNWIKALRANDILKRGVMANLEDITAKFDPNNLGAFLSMFNNPEDGHRALFMDLQWFRDSLQSKHEKTLGPIIHATQVYGEQVPFETPQVIVGTIHSVKGGEADCVYIFPDVSYKACKGMGEHQRAQDAMRRVFYVGFTRAKEELVLCEPSSNLYMELN